MPRLARSGSGSRVASQQLPSPHLFAPEARVAADRDRAQLTLELPPAREPLLGQLARLERGEHGAAGLARVRAVVELARARELLDLREGLAEPVAAVPQLEL